MKKCIIVITLIIICMFQGACNYNNDYNSNENVYKINLFNISIEIPVKWQLDYDSIEYKSYSYYENRKIIENLSFNLYENYSLESCLSEILFGLKESDILYGNIKGLKHKEITIDDEMAYSIDYDAEGRKYKLILLGRDKNTIVISFYSTSDLGYKEFQNAIKTIEVH